MQQDPWDRMFGRYGDLAALFIGLPLLLIIGGLIGLLLR